MVGKSMSADERRLALLWHTEDGMSPLAIATLLRRDKSTLTRFLVKKHVGKGRGRAKLLSPVDIAELVAHLEQLIKEADRQYEVTLRDLKEHSGCAASQKTIQRALHSLNIYFRPLRQKPLLTAEDVAARKDLCGYLRQQARSLVVASYPLAHRREAFPCLVAS